MRPSFYRSPYLLHSNERVAERSLKTVVLDGELVNKFMELAQSNTLVNIETCGVLAAKSVRDFANARCAFPQYLVAFLPDQQLECVARVRPLPHYAPGDSATERHREHMHHSQRGSFVPLLARTRSNQCWLDSCTPLLFSSERSQSTDNRTVDPSNARLLHELGRFAWPVFLSGAVTRGDRYRGSSTISAQVLTATLCLRTRARAQSYIRMWCSFGIFALTELGMEMIGQVRALAGALDVQVPLSHMCLVGGAV